MRSNQSTSVAKSFLILLALFAFGACASSSGGSPETGGASSVTLIVQNDLPAAGSLTVYAVPDIGGGRMLAGHVGAAQTATLRFRAAGSRNNSYRFLAQGLGGAQIASNIVSVRPGETVRWNLSSNVAYVAE